MSGRQLLALWACFVLGGLAVFAVMLGLDRRTVTVEDLAAVESPSDARELLDDIADGTVEVVEGVGATATPVPSFTPVPTPWPIVGPPLGGTPPSDAAPTFQPTAAPVALATATPVPLESLSEDERDFTLCNLTAAALLDTVFQQAYQEQLQIELADCPAPSGDPAADYYCRTRAESAAHDYAYE